MVKQLYGLLRSTELAPAKPFAWPALYAVLIVATMMDYLSLGGANFWLGLIALACFIRYPVQPKSNYRFLLVAILLLFAYLLIPVKTIFFFALIFALLFSVEAIVGKLNLAVIAVVFLMSPVANYAAEVFSFPIRLQLSAIAAKVLQLNGADAMAGGNSIEYNGHLFDVDKACMGLNMLVSSMLMAILSVWLFEVKLQRRLPLRYMPLVLVYFLIGNLVANITRIVALVYFNIEPNHMMHEIMGIICWIAYGVLPGIFLVRNMVSSWGDYDIIAPVKKFNFPNLSWHTNGQFILLIILTVALRIPLDGSQLNADQTALAPSILQDYETKSLPDGITSLKNETALIYVKPIRGFYSTDHNPSICWRGSGFRFSKVTHRKMGKATLYKAELTQQKTKLYTAWWYEQGQHRTNQQMEWRLRQLKNGGAYHLVNITAASPDELNAAIKAWMEVNDAGYVGIN